MGWTTFHFNGSRTEFIRDHLASAPEWCMLVDHAVVGSVIYAAVRLGSAHGSLEGKITCLVFLTSVNNRQYCNFAYKDMSEDMGPGACKCPQRILKLLSPIEELYPEGSNSRQWASEWRAKCSEPKKKPIKLEPGAIVKLEQPIRLSNGGRYLFFKYLLKNKWQILLDSNQETTMQVRFRASRFKFEILQP